MTRTTQLVGVTMFEIVLWSSDNIHLSSHISGEMTKLSKDAPVGRAARIAWLPRSLLDPESFPHTAYVKILATFARKTVN